jgi:hypothetical protein
MTKIVVTKNSTRKMITVKEIGIFRNHRTNRTNNAIAASSSSDARTMSQSLMVLFICPDSTVINQTLLFF